MKANLLLSVTLLSFLLASCNRGGVVTRTDTPTSGEATIASDDCFYPIVEEEIAVFTGLNPEATLNPVYAGEKEIFDFLLSDSIRLIVAARDVTEHERAVLKGKKLTVRSQKIATDGIALIVNKNNTDTIINTKTLKDIITGKTTKWSEINAASKDKKEDDILVVFDHPSSSTLRFISDSISQGEVLSNRLRALNGNKQVMEFVSATPNAIGVIGVNWISNPKDSTKLSFNESIRVMSISRDDNPDAWNSYKPYPAYFATKDYPLVRDVYIIISDVRGGLPSGFVTFVAGDSGQRIILKAGLVPATRPTRLINIETEF